MHGRPNSFLMDTVKCHLTANDQLHHHPTVTYALRSLNLHLVVIDNINRSQKQCLWRGNDTNKEVGNMVAWPLV